MKHPIKTKEIRYLLSQDGKTFYSRDKDGKSYHVEGLLEAELTEEIKNFPEPDKVSFYELTKLP